MALGRKTGGRRAGSRNKNTVEVKDIFAQVADSLGGAEGLLAWVQADSKNESLFWTRLYPRLLPYGEQGNSGEIKTPVIVYLPPRKARE